MARLIAGLCVVCVVANAAADIKLGPYGGEFGRAVSLDGARLAVGRPNPNGAGSAYVFEQRAGSWIHTATIPAPAPLQSGAEFGAAVALTGDWLFVGAPLHNGDFADSGQAFVFQRQAGGEWRLAQTLDPVVPIEEGLFGAALSAAGDTLAIGAPGNAWAATGRLHVYLLQRGAWELNSSYAGDRMGRSVATDAQTVVTGLNFGARVYRRDGSGQFLFDAELAPAIENGDFGYAVDVQADVIAVGAPSDGASWGAKDLNGLERVSAFRRVNGVWLEEASLEGYVPLPCGYDDSGICGLGILLAEFGCQNDCDPQADVDSDGDIDARDLGIFCAVGSKEHGLGRFGRAIGIDNGNIIVGAPMAHTLHTVRAGGAYVFSGFGSEWVNERLLTGGDAMDGAQFAAALSVENQRLAAGAPKLGSVYLLSTSDDTQPSATHALAPVQQSLIPNSRTFDLVINTADHPSGSNAWVLSWMKAQTDGAFYQDPFGSDFTPNPAFFSIAPKLKYDTFLTTPAAYPNTNATGYGISFPAISVTPQLIQYGWSALKEGGDPAIIARLTVVGGTHLTVTGFSMDAQVGSETGFIVQAFFNCPGDADNDGDADQTDLGLLLSTWGCSAGGCIDLDGDGDSDQADLGIILANFGCPSGA